MNPQWRLSWTRTHARLSSAGSGKSWEGIHTPLLVKKEETLTWARGSHSQFTSRFTITHNGMRWGSYSWSLSPLLPGEELHRKTLRVRPQVLRAAVTHCCLFGYEVIFRHILVVGRWYEEATSPSSPDWPNKWHSWWSAVFWSAEQMDVGH